MKLKSITPHLFWLSLLLASFNALPADQHSSLNIGVARIDITPDEPIRLSGYGSRRDPAEGTDGKLWAKALAIGEGDEPAFIVTLDLIGAPAWLTEGVAKELEIPQSQFALCASHTHSGPHLRDVLNPIFMADIPEEHWAAIERYSDKLISKVVAVCRMAMNNRQAGFLSWGQGEVGFAGNRRVLENGKWTGFGTRSDGPVDHSLPVLKATGNDGSLLAVLANYACHCTTLGGTFNHVHGDWAGAAQRIIEERHPGTMAMIAIGCGADANPNPRGSMNDVLQHGKSLADEVDRLLADELTPLNQVPETTLDWIDLPLDPLPSRQEWEAHAASEERTSYYAKQVLARLDRGETLPTSVHYPIQTWTFGSDLAMVFLAGEVVVDYAIKLKQRFDAERLWVTAYANAIPCYIASRRLYDEGGYEVDRSMLYYDKPQRLSPDTEDLVLDEVLQQMPYTFYSEETLARIPAPVSKEHALATIQAHPAVEVQLAAAEPLVMDPIDIAWDANGRMWVVEMADYPLGINDEGKPGGRVRFLEDDNGDGIYDRSTLFMDGLLYPTSVMPWREGVLIATPPDLIYARDTNGDGRADDSTALFTGFYVGNQQHLVNGLQWGLDGWVYLANGDSGGTVHSPQFPAPVRIDNLDLRILPDEGKVETLLGRTQFGRNRDSWGNWFGNNNSHPGWHYSLQDEFLSRNPHVSYPESKVHLFDPPLAPPVYPISTTLSRYNDYEKANRFTGISGLMIYEDEGLGEPFVGNAFFAESVHNAVSRTLVHPRDGTFFTNRAPEEQTSEFFASTDNWCRPTAIRSGPDGALYIVDMYRLVIEHPEWIPLDWQRKLQLREGHDKGRIYRVTEKGAKGRRIPKLTRMSAPELAKALDTNNRWQRDSIHQLLSWNPDPAAVPDLQQVAIHGNSAAARGQALWILSQLDGLHTDTLLTALRDPVAGVRQQAVRLSETLIETDNQVHQAVLDLAGDSDAAVRVQTAYTLGNSSSPEAGRTLATLALRDLGTHRMLAAVLSSALPHLEAILETSAATLSQPAARSLLRGLTQTAVGSGNRNALSNLLQGLLSQPGGSSQQKMDALAAVLQILKQSGMPLNQLLSDLPESAPLTQDLFTRARDSVAAQGSTLSAKQSALNLLTYDEAHAEQNFESLTQLFSPSTSTELQVAAVAPIIQLSSQNATDFLLEKWKSHSPRVRNQILNTLLRNRTSTVRLLKLADSDPAIAAAFSAIQVAELSRHRDRTIRELANQIFGQQVSSDREQLIEAFEPALELAGDPQAGKTHFATLCAACHRIGDLGFDVGPDLTALTDKSAHSMLIATLDPNRAVEDKYTQYTATARDGRMAVGIMAEESSNSITLITTGGLKQTLLRQNIQSLESSGTSLMPDGLEAGLDHQKMADLIAYLNASDESLRITAEPDGSIGLRASQALVAGPSAYYNPTLDAIEWIGESDSIQWTVYNLKAGYYDIFTDAAMAVEYEGRPFKLTMNDTFVTGAVVFSRSLTNFRKRKFGNISIEEDLPKAVFTLTHSLEGPVLNLIELRLIPAE